LGSGIGGRMKKRIGVFGGTFDPPHVGHQILGMESYDQLNLDVLFWVLAPQPPHKIGKKISPIEIRIKMVREAIHHDHIFKFSRVDIDREGPHYALDTMRVFRKRYPEDLLYFIMGGDSLHNLPSWYRSREFLHQCDKIGVLHRAGEKIDLYELEKELPGLTKKIEFIEAPLLEISSNQIRKLVAAGKPFRYYLPTNVYKIVLNEKLYI
jgi:nicotinate-nucleotide adenylyltransferase